MRIDFDFPDFRQSIDEAQDVLLKFPKYAATASLRFAKESFARQGWIDDRFERWASRKNSKDKRGILLGKGSSTLKKSVSVTHDARGWTISSDRKYAKIHNEGGSITVPVTPKMRKFFWAMHYKARTKADKARWRGMALTKKTSFNITMPKRQFMGKSAFLERRLVFNMGRALQKAMEG